MCSPTSSAGSRCRAGASASPRTCCATACSRSSSASRGVWLLAWRRFGRDRWGLACLVVVLIYGVVMAATAAGWIVRDWSEEVAVTYAPPTFLGPEAPRGASSAAAAETAPQGAREDYGIPDPLADDLAEIAKELAGASATETRAATLAFGADKWGRDVLKKAVKGTETSLFVGLVAAALAAFLGTLSGALAGYRGGWSTISSTGSTACSRRSRTCCSCSPSR